MREIKYGEISSPVIGAGRVPFSSQILALGTGEWKRIRMRPQNFTTLEKGRIAALVREAGPHVVVCPINGTRRWYAIEHADDPGFENFLPAILEKYRELFSLFFDHGVETLLSPILGPDIVARGDDYLSLVYAALEAISVGDAFRAFYRSLDIRVRFYGDYLTFFAQKNPGILPLLAAVQAETAAHTRHRLFWGMFAHDPVDWIAREAVRHFREHGSPPGRNQVVEAYYGDALAPADLFLGMMPPTVFDYPLLDTGETALYFTQAPTPYLDEPSLRRILYDYLYVRSKDESYDGVPVETWQRLARTYRAKPATVAGLGSRTEGDHFWLPSNEPSQPGQGA